MKTDQENTSGPISVLIVDDHPAVSQGLGLLLEPEGIAICAVAGSRTEALSACGQHKPDVVLVDLSLGDEDGMLLLDDLRNLGVVSLVYSMHENGQQVKRAFESGALGYVTKREVHGILVQAINEVAAGHRFVSPRAGIALAGSATDAPENATACELSHQEQEVYRLLGNGETTKGIAAAMNISARTVESYFDRILVKLNLVGMQELRRHAINHYKRTP